MKNKRGVILKDGNVIPGYDVIRSFETETDLLNFKKFLSGIDEDMGLNLNPKFQRGAVWSNHQKVAYMEHLLKGGKSGKQLYFNNPGYVMTDLDDFEVKDCVCVDGLQRITAISEFVSNEFSVFGDKKIFFKDIEDHYLASIRLDVFMGVIKTYEEIVQWYLDINTGGTNHTQDEIDKAKEELTKGGIK